MRFIYLLATVFAATVGTSTALVDARFRTTVTVEGAGYDDQTGPNGCTPDGCVPANTRDNSRNTNNRWSCKGDILGYNNDGCWIEYHFYDPMDIIRMRIAFHKGDERTTALDMWINDNYYGTITSNGQTTGYQNFPLFTSNTYKIRLRLDHYSAHPDFWLSILEVRFMVD